MNTTNAQNSNTTETTFLELIQGLSDCIPTNDIGIEDDSALLLVNNHIVLAQSIPSLRRLFLATGVFMLPSDKSREAVFTRLLQAQLFFAESNGAAFAYYAQKNAIVLQRVFPLFELAPDELFGHLKRLVDTAETFKAEFKNLTAFEMNGADSLSFMMNAIRV